MRRVFALLVLVALGAVAGHVYLQRHGLSAKGRPSAVEAWVAGQLRRLATPERIRQRANPLPATPEVLESARRHFADHCASCHANDGSGQTEIGQGLYPPAPDLRLAATQRLRDGELFAIIEDGIRFTGMPGWGDGSEASARQSWELVDFIRHLPRLTPQELRDMARFNPVSPMEEEERDAERRFLEGGPAPSPEPQHHEPH
ncbi:MAG: c-type cytochrome [Acidobacteriota bacterium]